jgi:hypothetical protein
VERDPHQGGLDHLVVAEGAIQLRGIEARDPIPQREIGRGRLLRLESDDPVDRLDDTKWLPGEEQLPRERRPVQLPRGDA